MSAQLSKPGPNTIILKDGWFYLPTFLKNGKYYPDPETCTLLVRRVQLRRGPSGRLRTVLALDAPRFPNEDEMARWIREHHAEELPPEADGDPRFIPEEYRVPASAVPSSGGRG
jgi:hypothetical protein